MMVGMANQITFTFSVSGNEAALKQALTNLEKSIRTIDLSLSRLRTKATKLVLTVKGHAFYEPAKTVELKDKVIKQ